jgi:hypothetical protein
MLVAHHLASQVLARYSAKCSRHDFTLPQLFACLCAKELLKRSYREAEAVLKDAKHWCHAIGMAKAPDHNTIWRASSLLLKKGCVNKLLDTVARWAALHRILGLSIKPLALDSSCYESHHVSRHFERRKRERRKREWALRRGRPPLPNPAKQTAQRQRTLKRLPKLAIALCAHSHLVLSFWTGTGGGSDSPHLPALLSQARTRVPHRHLTVVADAGYDAEANHRLARRVIGVRWICPALIGRPSRSGAPPAGRWRRHMKRLLGSLHSRRSCGYTQRWQVETGNSMMKRNLGSALRGRSTWSRKRDLHLKVLTHNVMIIRRWARVETEH